MSREAFKQLTTGINYRIALTSDTVREYLKDNKPDNGEYVISLDTETSGLQPYKGDFICAIPFRVYGAAESLLIPVKMADLALGMEPFTPVKELIENGCTVIGTNFLFDMNFFGLQGIFFDACTLYDVRWLNYFERTYRGAEYASLEKLSFKEGEEGAYTQTLQMVKLYGNDWKSKGLHTYLTDEIAEYAIADVVRQEFVYTQIRARVEQHYDKMFFETESTYMKVLFDLHFNGVPISKTLLTQTKEAVQNLLPIELAKVPINPQSPVQVKKLLGTKDSKKETLVNLGCEMSKSILRCKELRSLESRFLTKLESYLCPSGKVHPTFLRDVTFSNRLSSKEPNGQNLPRREDEFSIRRLITEEGRKIAWFDYGQIERVVMASNTGDKVLFDALFNGLDLHQKTADLLGCTRELGKIINFSVDYGLGLDSFAAKLKLSKTVARPIFFKLKNSYPGVISYTAQITDYADNKGFIKLIGGLKIWFDHPAKATFKAVAIKTQGDAGVILRDALVRLWTHFGNLRGDYKLILQVHDEIVWNVPEDVDWEKFKEEVTLLMKYPNPLKLDFSVSAKIGSCWGK